MSGDATAGSAPAWQRGEFCTWKEYAGHRAGGRCPECGHAVVVHIGTEHCPVCELLYQATPEFRRQQQRIAGIPAWERW